METVPGSINGFMQMNLVFSSVSKTDMQIKQTTTTTILYLMGVVLLMGGGCVFPADFKLKHPFIHTHHLVSMHYL